VASVVFVVPNRLNIQLRHRQAASARQANGKGPFPAISCEL
jgi:hypothetical protein